MQEARETQEIAGPTGPDAAADVGQTRSSVRVSGASVEQAAGSIEPPVHESGGAEEFITPPWQRRSSMTAVPRLTPQVKRALERLVTGSHRSWASAGAGRHSVASAGFPQEQLSKSVHV